MLHMAMKTILKTMCMVTRVAIGFEKKMLKNYQVTLVPGNNNKILLYKC